MVRLQGFTAIGSVAALMALSCLQSVTTQEGGVPHQGGGSKPAEACPDPMDVKDGTSCKSNDDCVFNGELCCYSAQAIDTYCSKPKATPSAQPTEVAPSPKNCSHANTVYNHGDHWSDGDLSCNCTNGQKFCQRSGDCDNDFTMNTENCNECQVGMDQLCKNNEKCCPASNSCPGKATACLPKRKLRVCSSQNNLAAGNVHFKEGQTVISPYYPGLPSECQSCTCSSSGTAVRTGGKACTGRCAPNRCYINDEKFIEENDTEEDTISNRTHKYTCSCLVRKGILTLKCGLSSSHNDPTKGSGAAVSALFQFAALGIIITMAMVSV